MAVQHSLELDNGSCDDDGHPARTGTLWSCVAHIITAVIGSGVLSLAWSTSQLGWLAGPIALLIFAIITYLSAFLLSDCYRTNNGTRNKSYMDAVRMYLGRKRTWMCALLQNLSLYGTDIAYVITTSTSMRAIQKSNCYHREGHKAACSYGDTSYMLLFGGVQVVMSQIPDFHNMEWLSVVAAIMSFTYSFIGFGLGFAQVIENGRIQGSITGVPADSVADKLWLAFQALGDIAFAYPYSIILLEIQDTLKSPPPENKTMKTASMIAIFVTTFFYLCCGCFGYAAFGNNTPGNLLTGFGFYEPYWLIDFANACIVLHLVGGYQIFSQPVFAFVERWFTNKFPGSGFVNNFYTIKLPLLPSFQMNPLKICFRTAYVASTTVIAMIFPYFNQVLGVLGALNFWPLAIYFPVEMYFVQKKIQPWTRKWVVLRTFSFFCLLVTIVGLIGSIQGLISAKFG
ncbi:probable amino acid permease 7 isoform X2 [Gossypium arboreum]|nr:probable amino acid permease 7 isoform X2 [Gossypium arboreum]XP_017649565.1 probable amino acid permease 7 isoform X2 [Gossypium arboreum]